MRTALLLGAMAAASLAFVDSAQAQHGPSIRGGFYQSPNYGYSGHAVPGIGYGSYSPGHSGFGRGHIDFVPGHFDRHRGHYHYVPAHTDYHIGGRRYEVVPGPYGSTISPWSHRRD